MGNTDTNRRSRRNSRDLTGEMESTKESASSSAPVEEGKKDLATLLREMEMEVEEEAQKATAERNVVEQAEKEAENAATIAAAAAQARMLDKDLKANEEANEGSWAPDLKMVRVRRKSRELEIQAKELLAESLESTFASIDLDKSGTLDLDEVQKAFKKGGKLHFDEETLKPLLEDLVSQNGGQVNFEQFKSIAWQASIKEAQTPRGR